LAIECYLPQVILRNPQNHQHAYVHQPARYVFRIIDLLRDVDDDAATAVSKIGIIGAGPAGLATLKTVLDSPQYKAGQWIPTAFEARENIGGVW
jgi:hypothetical protein